MNYIFDFSYLKNGAPVVTLSSLGISFNRGAVDLLGAPEEIVIGYDARNNAVGVRAASDNNEEGPKYHFASRVKNDWVRIGAKDFAKHLSRTTGIDFITKAKQFVPEYDEESKTLIVVVTPEHLR